MWPIGGDLRALMDAAARRWHPGGRLIQIPRTIATPWREKLGTGWAERIAEGSLPSAAPDRPARLVRQTLYRSSWTLRPAKAHQGSRDRDLAREDIHPLAQSAVEWRLPTHRIANRWKR
ncbi:MAG: hypothetical protein IPL59_05895 [Candidatus Competibacteraceae bacterium]|nr:hypothetical protein [Candidatus Competibacteraceae bacterium]